MRVKPLVGLIAAQINPNHLILRTLARLHGAFLLVSHGRRFPNTGLAQKDQAWIGRDRVPVHYIGIQHGPVLAVWIYQEAVIRQVDASSRGAPETLPVVERSRHIVRFILQVVYEKGCWVTSGQEMRANEARALVVPGPDQER